MNSVFRGVAVGAVVGFTVAVLSCGASGHCDATTCASGCCDATGTCRPGTSDAVCGAAARACVACQSGQSCAVGVCGASHVDAGTGGGSGGGGVGGGSGGGSGGGAGGGSGSANVVFNEVRATGSEYLELFNAGTAVKDLSGYSVADSIADGGGPKVSSALQLPSGTTLAPGGFLLIITSRASNGPTTDCYDAGVSSCFEATYGISNSSGEAVWLLNPQGTVETTESYPAHGAPSGSAWGRIPDGTGAFVVTTPTPGAANQL